MVRRSFGKEPCLSDFASFVHEETTLVNDPIFSKDAVLVYAQTPEKKHYKKKKYGSSATKRGEVLKCCVKQIMILKIVTHFYSFIYKEEVSGFITNCVMAVLKSVNQKEMLIVQ